MGRLEGRPNYRELEEPLKRRIRICLIVAGGWFGLLMLGAGSFLLTKPLLDKRRKDRKSAIEKSGRIDT